MTVHVHPEALVPPENLSRAFDIHGGVEHHFAAPHVLHELLGVLGELVPLEASREAEQLAGARRLGAGLDVGGAEERSGVEDGHLRGGVLDRGDVRVGDVDGEDDVSVHDGEIGLEGGEIDGDEVECRVARLGGEQRRRRSSGSRSDQGGGPAPPPGLPAAAAAFAAHLGEEIYSFFDE